MLFYIGPSIIKKIGEVFSLVITFFLFAISSFYTAFVFTTEVNFFHVAFSRFLFGLGLILFIAPLLGLSSKGINEKDLPSSTSLFHFIRALMGGVGTSVFTTIFYRRTIFHHERIGSSFSALNPITPRISAEKPLAIWDSLLEKEASLLAINEVFYLMGILFLALIVIFSASKIYVKNSG
jgi:DHA2 family multidrug resistance protein